MSSWQNFADAASVDIAAACHKDVGPAEALEHLRDAQNNIECAVDALEDTLEGESE